MSMGMNTSGHSPQPPNKTLQPTSRASTLFEFATFCSRGLRLNVEPLGANEIKKANSTFYG
jgi:hypothetical protein